mgnify:CR=1 FL=1
MTKTLPDCPHCAAANTLTAVRADVRGLRWCECSCCGKECLVEPSGEIRADPPKTDVSGNAMDDGD